MVSLERTSLLLFLVLLSHLAAEEIEPALCLLQSGFYVQRPSELEKLTDLEKLVSSFDPAVTGHQLAAVDAPLALEASRDGEAVADSKRMRRFLADSLDRAERTSKFPQDSTLSALRATEPAERSGDDWSSTFLEHQTALVDPGSDATVSDTVTAAPLLNVTAAGQTDNAYEVFMDSVGLTHAISAAGLLATLIFQCSICILCGLCAGIGIVNDNTDQDLTPWYCDICVEIGQCCTNTCNPVNNPYIVSFAFMYLVFMNIFWIVYAANEATKFQGELIVGLFVAFAGLGAVMALIMICRKRLTGAINMIPGFEKLALLPDKIDDVTDFLGITECSSDDEVTIFQWARNPCRGGEKAKEGTLPKDVAKEGSLPMQKSTSAGKLAKKKSQEKNKKSWY